MLKGEGYAIPFSRVSTGLTAVSLWHKVRHKYPQVIETLVLTGEHYHISKKLFHFLVNLTKTCTDITFEIRGDCTGLNGTAKMRIEYLSDVLLLVVSPKDAKGDIQ